MSGKDRKNEESARATLLYWVLWSEGDHVLEQIAKLSRVTPAAVANILRQERK